MSDKEASKRGLKPLGIFRGFVAAGCEPDEMGIGPVFAVPRLLKRHGLKVDDIDLWELNEAFAVQVLYCRDKLGIDPEKINVNGGAIAVGHPYGMSGARLTGHALDRGPPPQGQICRGDDVRRRRHGRGRFVRGGAVTRFASSLREVGLRSKPDRDQNFRWREFRRSIDFARPCPWGEMNRC